MCFGVINKYGGMSVSDGDSGGEIDLLFIKVIFDNFLMLYDQKIIKSINATHILLSGEIKHKIYMFTTEWAINGHFTHRFKHGHG